MDLTTDLEQVIYNSLHIPRSFAQPAPPTPEALAASWARARQDDFDVRGLPRGIAGVL